MAINSFCTSGYRCMLRKSWRNKVKNEDILKLVGKGELIQTVKRRQLRFLGKNLKQDDISKYTLYEPQIGKVKRGRGKYTYRKYIEKMTNKSAEELRRMALNEREWRTLIIGVT